MSHVHFHAALDLYSRNGLEQPFWKQLEWHFSYAHVLSTPDYFVMFHPWERDREHLPEDNPVELADADCWYFQYVGGDAAKFVPIFRQLVPKLPFLAAHRLRLKTGVSSLKYYPYELFLHHLETQSYSLNGQRRLTILRAGQPQHPAKLGVGSVVVESHGFAGSSAAV
jgi:hypothetical protein